MADRKSRRIPENVIQVSDIGEGVHLSAERGKLIRVLELEEEFYRTHAVRRMLKRLHLLAAPDKKARNWALQRYKEEKAN